MAQRNLRRSTRATKGQAPNRFSEDSRYVTEVLDDNDDDGNGIIDDTYKTVARKGVYVLESVSSDDSDDGHDLEGFIVDSDVEDDDGDECSSETAETVLNDDDETFTETSESGEYYESASTHSSTSTDDDNDDLMIDADPPKT